MSFLAPWGLALGALAVPLVALYFLKLRRRRVKVPSVLLWQAFQKSEQLASPFQRFRNNLLLWLQLLVLALLALAFARPYLQTDVPIARSVVIVVDTSASMGASDGDPDRLGSAVTEAHDLVSALGSGDEAMLITAGPVTEVRVPFTRDHGRLGAELDRLVATQAEGTLREGLQLALSMARSRPGVEVVVYSDGGGGGLADLPRGNVGVHLVSVGKDATNAGLLAVDVRRSPASDLDRQLFVTVQGYGKDLDAAVEVYVDDELIGLRNETLRPEVPVHLVFDLPGDAKGIVRVELDAPGDVLRADDTAWLVISPLSLRRVVLVGGDALTARALSADPRVQLKRVSAFDKALLDEADVTLFASGTVPEGLGGYAYGVLAPLPGSPVTFGAEVSTPRILGWQRTHPVARFVAWDDALVARSRAVTNSGGLVPIVESDGGPLVLAGELGGGRVVQLAFDPLESDLPLRVAWPVTLLNVVGWLGEGAAGSDEGSSVPTGSPWIRRLPEGLAEVSVRGPEGDVDAVVADGLLRVRDTSRVGVYEVRGDGLQTRFAANLLSPRESDVTPRDRLELTDAVVASTEASVAGRRELWRPLALAAFVFLLLEWAAWSRRRAA